MGTCDHVLRASFERSSLTLLNSSSSVVHVNDDAAAAAADDADAGAAGVSPSRPFKAMKATPNEIEGGALRSGGAPNLYSRENIGLLVNYASVGLVYGMFPRTVYPFLQMYLYMDGYQAAAASVLVSMPWSFKTFIGIASDSFPIMGFRRRPYMVIGWSVCLIILIVMAWIPVAEPYYVPGDIHLSDPRARRVLNPQAPDSGSIYIVLMMFASLGYVIADVAADGMVVEFAQREPEHIRGTTQTTIYLTRTLFSVLSSVIVAFGFNGKAYGGDFDFSISFNWMMVITAFGAAWSIPASIWLLTEETVVRESFGNRCGEMWKICQQRAIWQILAFNFFNALFYGFGAAPATIVQREWAKVRPLTDNVFSVLGLGVFAMSLWVTKKYFLHADWRRLIFITTLSVVGLDMIVGFLTIFDVFRNQWFWLGVPILETLPEGMRFIVGTYVTVEIAQEGYEGATYGLITTVHNLATPFATSLYKQVDALFDAYDSDIERDDAHARMQVAYTFIIMYAMKVLSNVFLPLLPRQKKEAQALKAKGGSSPVAGALCIIIASFSLVWSIMTNLMSIFPSTKCLKIAGGSGCA